MFVAPPENQVEWTDTGLRGIASFLSRVWRIVDQWIEGGIRDSRVGIRELGSADLTQKERAIRRKTHDTIRRVTIDIEQRQQLNTAVSAMMELVNDLYAFGEPAGARPQSVAVVGEAVDALVRMLSPFAPHTCEELWEMLGHRDGLMKATWPEFNAAVAKAEEIVIPVQVNGKVRSRLTVPAESSEKELEALALADPAVMAHLAGKQIKKVVVAKGRLVSLVV
jgi:leucyl-tRNA synthetase